MCIVFIFVGRILSITGVGGFRTANILHLDSDATGWELEVKYFQNNDTVLLPERTYLFCCESIIVPDSFPKVRCIMFLINFKRYIKKDYADNIFSC